MANELVITASSLAERGIDGATWSALKTVFTPRQRRISNDGAGLLPGQKPRSASEARSSGADER